MESNAGACDCGGAQRCDSAGTAYRTQQNYGRSAAVQEIESVSFRNSYDHVGSGSYLYYTDYVGQNTQNIKITDPTAISLISYYFNENVKCFEEDPDSYYESTSRFPMTMEMRCWVVR